MITENDEFVDDEPAQEFKYQDDIPIFHELKDVNPSGDSQNWNPETLAKAAAINNARIERGESPTIILGHKDADNPRPPAIGFIDKFSLGVRNGLLTLFARYKIYAEKWDELKANPYRSIEIHWDELTIPAVALLSSNPALELGAHKFSGKKLCSISLNNFNDIEGDSMTDVPVSDDLCKAILSVLQGTDVFAFVKQQMDAAGTEGDDDAQAEADAEQSADSDDAKEASDDEPDKATDDDDKKPSEDDKSDDKDQKPSADDDDKDKKQASKFSKVEQEKRKIERERDDLRTQLRIVQREKTLMSLHAEGFEIDVDNELRDTADESDKTFAKHVDLIKRFSKRAPVNVNFDVSRIDNNGGSGILPPAELERVKAYATKHGIKFADAVREYKV